MATQHNILTEDEISLLTKLKEKWPKERIREESYETYTPNTATIARLRFQRWRYENKLINEGGR